MSKSVLQWMEEYIRRAFRSRVWHKFMQMMVCIVVFCTTYALILPALTMEQQYACGIEEHLHGETCYELRREIDLICTPESLGMHVHSESCGDGTLCGYRGSPVHTHEAICYDAAGGLICPLEALAEHTHADGCYEAGPLVCTLEELQGHAHGDTCLDAAGNLSCTLEEQEGHTHDAACYGPAVLTCTGEAVQVHSHSEECLEPGGGYICGLLQTAAHQHDESCVSVVSEEKILICGVEEHIHASNCNSNPEADVETPEQWVAGLSQVTLTGRWADDLIAVARSQLGYQESQLNFLMENGARKGYTRYGHWYGITYADWDAMFVSFCLHHAGIPAEAITGSAYSDQWLEAMQAQGLTAPLADRFPAVGEILFFRAEDDSVRSGVINAVDTELDENGETRIAQLRVIAGNIDDRVTEAAVAADKTLAVVSMEQASLRYETALAEAATEGPTEVPTEPALTLTQQAETENYIVTVSYSPDLALPEGAELRVSEYARDSDIFRQRCEEAGYELEWLLNIGFFLEDTELELDGAFDVRVTGKQGQALGQNITHFADEGAEQLDAVSVEEDGQTSVLFSADGFSDFGGGVAVAAAAATVNLNITCWSSPIQFSGGNTINCPVGSTITIKVGMNGGGANPNTPSISVSGGELISVETTCDSRWCSHNITNWCTNNLTRTITVKVTSAAVTVSGTVDGGQWNANTWSVTAPESGGTTDPTEPTPTEPTPTEPEATQPVIPSYPYYPTSVETGDTKVTPFRFYNFRTDGAGGVAALDGCVFEIVGDNGKTYTLTSKGNEPLMELPADLPNGRYTITEVSAPDGYMTDARPTREFQVENGHLVGQSSIGNFINHDIGALKGGKTAEVEDYANRIYQVLLNASTDIRRYAMDPIDVRFVVDQSNSMLFPSGLEPIGKSVTLSLDGSGNVQNLENLNLDKTKMHYIISDPNGSSTVWAVWYNGQAWMYQDSSYYAKADHNNAEGYQQPDGEKAIFPQNRSYSDQAKAEADNERSNGGGIGYSLSGSGLGKDIDKASNDQKTFQLYYATGQYNRLHYLEQGLAHIISELADANPENVISLTRFTKEVNEEDCIEHTVLSPDNLNGILNEVDGIETSGGTRQDLALKHVYENNNHQPTAGYPSYTVLITDGAPVISGDPDELPVPNAPGDPDDPASTTANSVYAQIKGYANLIKSPQGENSTLISIALGMNDVEGGKKVLREIASPGHFYECDDASGLVNALQELLFAAMKPRESIPTTGNVVDEISDSFYPIAWLDAGTAADQGRTVLATSGGKDWFELKQGEWITLDGKLTQKGAADAAGQLLRRADGTFYIQWLNQNFNDPYLDDIQHIAWVTPGTSHNRTVVRTDSDKEWILLQNGDWISSQGQYQTTAPSRYNQSRYGQYSNGTITWGRYASDQRTLYTPGYDEWNGTFYVKAREDFIGGNAIDTNKSAAISAYGDSISLKTPTVNVRLLEINEMSTEVTVYLGDTINEEGHSPLDSLKYFYENTRFDKLIADGTDVLNKLRADASAEDGLEDAVFYLRYAMGQDLTADQWNALMNGETVTMSYTYDNDSSHGAVGYFSFTLTKEGEGADYGSHQAGHACQPGGEPLTEDCDSPAETYTLNITYTAYRLGENGRPAGNVYNGSGHPGTEVGGEEAGDTVEEGLGQVKAQDIHEVHVISGRIELWKEIDDTLASPDETQKYPFTLYRVEGTEYIVVDRKEAEVLPGSLTSARVSFDNLPRGTYVLAEEEGTAYVLENLTIDGSTNCENSVDDIPRATFVMGNNTGGADVIGRAQDTDMYTSYIDPVNGVYGAAKFSNTERVYYDEIPVTKVWTGDTVDHTGEAVYVMLYQEGTPVLVDGQPRLLRLDAESGWTGKFTVVVPDPDTDAADLGYSVREVAQTSVWFQEGFLPATLENDGSTIYYYKALEADAVTDFGGRAYIVQYTPGEEGAWTVTNIRAVEIPETGGLGTHQYTISGTLLIAAALVYGYSQRRKRERRGS